MKPLTKEEMKQIVGGTSGTCCAHSGDNIYYVSCGLSKSTAIAYANQYAATSGNSGYWCCDSCAQTLLAQ